MPDESDRSEMRPSLSWFAAAVLLQAIAVFSLPAYGHDDLFEMGLGACASAQGGCLGSLSGDLSLLFYDPAGLVAIQALAAETTYGLLPDGYAVTDFTLGGKGFGIGISSLEFGDVSITDEFGIPIGVTELRSTAVMIGAAWCPGGSFGDGIRWVNHLSLGLLLKSHWMTTPGDEPSIGLSADVSFALAKRWSAGPLESATLSFIQRNLIPEAHSPGGSHYSTEVRGGIQFRWDLDLNCYVRSRGDVGLGIAWRPLRQLTLRAGVRILEPTVFTYGVTLALGQFKADASVSMHPALTDEFRLEFGYEYRQ